MYGIDWDGPVSMDDDFEEPEHVIVNAINNPFSSEQYEDLRTTINPLSPSSYYGIDLYLTALSFVHNML